MDENIEDKEQEISDEQIKSEHTNPKKEISKKQVIIIVSIFLSILILGILAGILVIKFIAKGNDLILKPKEQEISQNQIPIEQEKEITIFKGTDRPIAVMIDNEKPAWPHAGLNDAYLLYEITIEGGESRIMALFKGQTTEKIGPVRSARHYFLDYVQENDAMYVHFGWSPKAQSDIKTYNINNLNGVTNDGTIFWREGTKPSYHNAFTSIENILSRAEKKEYRKTSSDKGIFNYSSKEVLLNTGLKADDIKIKYSTLHNVEYKYNKETKLYERYQRGLEHKDRFTSEFFVAKNIIVCYIDNGLLDDPEKKGRQDLYNIGTGDGVLITNGEYQDIKWEKTSRNLKTKYTDSQGKEIILNDGITWVQIIPKDNKIEVK